VDRRLLDLEKAATILEAHLNDSVGMKLMGKQQAFQFFSYLFNLRSGRRRPTALGSRC